MVEWIDGKLKIPRPFILSVGCAAVLQRHELMKKEDDNRLRLSVRGLISYSATSVHTTKRFKKQSFCSTWRYCSWTNLINPPTPIATSKHVHGSLGRALQAFFSILWTTFAFLNVYWSAYRPFQLFNFLSSNLHFRTLFLRVAKYQAVPGDQNG